MSSNICKQSVHLFFHNCKLIFHLSYLVLHIWRNWTRGSIVHVVDPLKERLEQAPYDPSLSGNLTPIPPYPCENLHNLTKCKIKTLYSNIYMDSTRMCFFKTDSHFLNHYIWLKCNIAFTCIHLSTKSQFYYLKK